MESELKAKIRETKPGLGGANICAEADLTEGFFGSTGETEKPSLLLHSCCGPCSTAVIERLMPDYDITVFYYNPCITDPEEYAKRRENQIAFIEAYNNSPACISKVGFMDGDYEPEEYYAAAGHLGDEPEGGKRCEICFGMRIGETARCAAELKFDLFTTTLSVSPHKNYDLIVSIGKRFEEEYGVPFLDLDFKKKAGFQRSVQLSKEYGLYRQDYCGCEFSKQGV